MPRILTFTLFCLVFFHGLISERVFGASWALTGEADSRVSQAILEGTLCLTTFWLLFRRPVRIPPGATWFFLYVVWSLLSGLLTTDTVLDGFMYCRFTIYAFLLYLAVWNYPFSKTDLASLNRLIAVLAVVQLAATLVKLFVFGDRTEWRVGTMMIAGGGLATIFPLLALAFVMGYYFYVRHSWWLLLAGFSFSLIAYASGKRAIYFLAPAVALLNLALYCWLERGRRVTGVAPRFLAHLALCGVLLSPALLYGIEHSEGIGFAAEGATASELIDHAVDYALGYEFGRASSGLIAGRGSATERVVDSVADAPPKTLLFGWGPAALMPKRGDALEGGAGFAPLGITYGIVGWSRDAISIGLPGAAFMLLFLVSILRALYHRTKRGRMTLKWKAICFGTLGGFLVLMYTHLLYDTASMPVTLGLFFYAAILMSPIQQPQLKSLGNLYADCRFRIVPCKRQTYDVPEESILL